MRDLARVTQGHAQQEAPCEHASSKQYAHMCTTCIVGTALTESGTASYDEESVFDRFDLLDPDFASSFGDKCRDESTAPEDFLSALCGGFIEEIINVIGEMEMSWLARSNRVADTRSTKAASLWELVRGDASVYVGRAYGGERAAEFFALGEEMFGPVLVANF